MYLCVKENSNVQEGVINIIEILNFKFMNKSIYLFSDSQVRKVKPPEQKEFEINNRELLTFSANAIEKAMKMVKEEESKYPKHYRGRNWHSTNLNGFLQGLIIDEYPRQMKCEQGSYVFYAKESRIKFKKLSEKFIPDNIQTQNVTRDRNQMCLFDTTTKPVVYIGYTLNESRDQITGSYAVCLDNWDQIKWITDLSDFTNVAYYKSNEQPVETELHVRVKPSASRKTS